MSFAGGNCILYLDGYCRYIRNRCRRPIRKECFWRSGWWKEKWPGISGEQSDATGSVSGNVPGENVQTGDTVSDGNQTDQTMGTVQSPATGEEAAMPETTGTETQDPAATVPVEEIPQEVVYHTVDDSYFDDAVFIGDSRTVGNCFSDKASSTVIFFFCPGTDTMALSNIL